MTYVKKDPLCNKSCNRKKLFFTTFFEEGEFLLGVSAKVSITNSKWRYFFERYFNGGLRLKTLATKGLKEYFFT
jgi:hypothetical protein